MRVLELFSGIGGMHFAFKESGVDYEVVRALDINPTANCVYKFNFPDTKLMENNIQCLNEEFLNKLQIDCISMSPPCQPFTRLGSQKGSEDNRTDALKHILQLIPKIINLKFIILENVVGFETSLTRNDVLTVLETSNFKCQEFILNPTQFYIPNSRARYYLLAKKIDKSFIFKEIDNRSIHTKIPDIKSEHIIKLVNKHKKNGENCYKIKEILNSCDSLLKIPDKILIKYCNILDIVVKDSNGSCCFTKGYSHYIEGTGSVFCPFTKEKIDKVYKNIKDVDKNSDEYLNELKSLDLRFFSPLEISKLMAFPDNFKFPENLSLKQKYRLLGNSINVHVVSILIQLLAL